MKFHKINKTLSKFWNSQTRLSNQTSNPNQTDLSIQQAVKFLVFPIPRNY